MHAGKYNPESVNLAIQSLETDIYEPLGLNWVPAFEQTWSKFVGAKYAIAVNSGTSGLHAALLASGVGPGDEVISPALTVIMDAFSTIYCGATPVFADVEDSTWNIDPIEVEKLITPRTKVIISVSWFGLSANLTKLKEISRKYNLILIDDSAETILPNGFYRDDLNDPDFRVFSFESKKHMSTGGEGGMIVTNSDELAVKARKAAGLGYKHLSADKGRTSLAAKTFQNPAYERFDALGFNYRMTPVTAAIGLGQLEGIQNSLRSRIRCAEMFSEAVKGCGWLVAQPQVNDGYQHAYYTFGVRFLGLSKRGITWSEFYDRFTSAGGDGFYSNCKIPYNEPYFREIYSKRIYGTGYCPVAEELQTQIMAFKTNYLDFEKVDKQVSILRDLIDGIGR